MAEVDDLVGSRKRSEFIRQAIEDHLRIARKLKALDEFGGSLKDADNPGWEPPESRVEWVRTLRREADESARLDGRTTDEAAS